MSRETITTERDKAQLRELANLPALDALPDDALVSVRVRAAYSGEAVETIYNKRSAGNDPIPSVTDGRAVRYRVCDLKALLRGNLGPSAVRS